MTTTAESPILVLGATGGQGGAVTAALLARQVRVRAMVRRSGEPSVQRLTERGVEVMVGSLDDRTALGPAMEGAAAVFALRPRSRPGWTPRWPRAEPSWPRPTTRGFPTWCSARSLGRTSIPGCRTSTARPSSKRIWPQAVCPTRSPPRRTSSTTRWAGPTVSLPGSGPAAAA